MRAVTSLISKVAIGALSLASMGGAVLAEAYDADLYSTYYTTGDSSDAFAAMFTGGFAIVWICLALLGCLFLVFNIWMLVDVIKRTEAEVPNKTLWLVLLIAGLVFGFGGIVALVYYFSVKRRLDSGAK